MAIWASPPARVPQLESGSGAQNPGPCHARTTNKRQRATVCACIVVQPLCLEAYSKHAASARSCVSCELEWLWSFWLFSLFWLVGLSHYLQAPGSGSWAGVSPPCRPDTGLFAGEVRGMLDPPFTCLTFKRTIHGVVFANAPAHPLQCPCELWLWHSCSKKTLRQAFPSKWAFTSNFCEPCRSL